MKKRVLLILLLLVAALAGTAWAAGEPELTEGYEEVDLFQCGSLDNACGEPEKLSIQETGDSLVDTLVQGMAARSNSIDISAYGLLADQVVNDDGDTIWAGKDVDALRSAFAQAVNGHPDLVYVMGSYGMSGRWSGGRILITEIKPKYDDFYTEEVMQRFEAAIQDALAAADGMESDVEKLLALHDYLMDHVAYNWEVSTKHDAPSNRVFNAYGALVEGDAVCQGYALAYKLLLNRVGIESILVSSDELNHAWNLVKVGESWYHVDVTWDDPTPNANGAGRHSNFLRSDKGIWEEGHDGAWDAAGISCETDYIEDWWLNQVWYSVYFWQDTYYYVCTSGDPFTYQVYTTQELSDPGKAVISGYLDNSWSSRNGVAWVEGQLYYTKSGGTTDRLLTRFDLSSGDSAVIGTIPFERTASADGYYSASHDGMGLYYDKSLAQVLAYSNNHPDITLGRFQVRTYPVTWDQMPDDITALAGGIQMDDTLQIGLVWAEDRQDASLVAAFYQDGRMVKVRMEDADGWEDGLNVLKLDTADYPDYDRVVLYLLSDSGVPLCASKTAV